MELIRVVLVGTGRMGIAFGERIRTAGFPLVVPNRTAHRAKPLLDLGARWAEPPAAVAAEPWTPARVGIVPTALSDEYAVDAVYTGPNGLLCGARAATVFVEASTVRTSTVTRLDPLVRATGTRLVDTPAGRAAARCAGQLLVIADGTPSDIAAVEPAAVLRLGS